MRVRKELQKHVEVSPIVVRKGMNVRSHLLHRNACVSALRLIIMSTLGGGAKAKYDYEAASIKSVLRTATGCADEESCAKVGIAVVQNTFVPKWAESSSNVYSLIEELVANELETAIKLSGVQKEQINIIKDIEQAEIEMHIREILNLVLSILPNAPAVKIILRTSVLNSLLSYLDIGSFPTRRCIYRILRTAFCDKSFNETLLSVPKKDFIKNLVHNIGAFYLGSGVTNTAEVDSAKTALLGLGDFRSYVCCEEVCLMRTLQRISVVQRRRFGTRHLSARRFIFRANCWFVCSTWR